MVVVTAKLLRAEFAKQLAALAASAALVTS